MKDVYKAENTRKKKIADFVNQIPWVQNLDIEFYWEGNFGSKGLRSTSPIGKGFTASENMIEWLWGYADGIYAWEVARDEKSKKIRKGNKNNKKRSKM